MFTSYTDVFTTIHHHFFVKIYKIRPHSFIEDSVSLIIFLLIRELFIDDYLTRTNHAQLNFGLVRLHSNMQLGKRCVLDRRMGRNIGSPIDPRIRAKAQKNILSNCIYRRFTKKQFENNTSGLSSKAIACKIVL